MERGQPSILHTAGECCSTQDLPPTRARPPLSSGCADFFFFLSLSWLRRGVEKWTEEEPRLRREAPVFDLPVSTAITLSFLALGSLYSTAPFLLRAILWGVLLISITVILRRLVDRALFPMLDALIVLYFVDQFRLLSSLLPFVGRLLFGMEMLGGTLFFIWLISKMVHYALLLLGFSSAWRPWV